MPREHPVSKEVDVLLVSMPFGPLGSPSIGLGLLQGAGVRADIDVQSLYLCVRFAERVGVDLYRQVDRGAHAFQALVGDWIFSSALFPDFEHDIDGYVSDVLLGGLDEHAHRRAVSEALVEDILRAREEAPGFIEECCAEVLSHGPRMVGFTSVFQQQTAALALARRLKEEAPDTFLLFGGANCEGIMGTEMVRQFSFIDAVVSGEGDLIFPELARRVLDARPIEDIQGVVTRATLPEAVVAPPHAPSVHDLDGLPYPIYDDFFDQASDFLDDHEDVAVTFPFESSRGCWWGERHHCTFCGLNGETMTFRSKSPDRAMSELRYLVERHPGRIVTVVDNILDMRYFRDFIPELAALGLGLELFYEVKANLKKEQIVLLRDAGITSICPGVESLSSPILTQMRKGVSALQNVQLLKWCKELGVHPFWNVLWSFPGEDPAEYAAMAELIPAITHLQPPLYFLPIRLDRFSPYFDDPASFGIDRVYPYPSYGYVYPGMDADTVHNLAYYLTSDPESRRAAESYTDAVGQAIEDWRGAEESSDLVVLDDGTSLRIFDTRPTARRPFTELSGVDRVVYRECDAIRSPAQIQARIREDLGVDLSSSELERTLGSLVADRLMLEERGRFLSLAVQSEEYAPGGAAMASFLERIVASGTPIQAGQSQDLSADV